MSTLLHIDSSPMGDYSVSRHLSSEFTRQWQEQHPGAKVITRDLTTSGLTPITAAWVGAAYTPEANRTPEQAELLKVSDALLAELFEADEYVFGVPMHNFAPPSTFKLWIDLIARVGRTFAYGANGPEGLLQGKKATLLISTGGQYGPATPTAQLNFVEPYIRTVFGFLGIADLTVVTAGGTAALMNPATDRAAFLAPHTASVQALFAK
jgi:FMN-dependent NADH-azoreductase